MRPHRRMPPRGIRRNSHKISFLVLSMFGLRLNRAKPPKNKNEENKLRETILSLSACLQIDYFVNDSISKDASTSNAHRTQRTNRTIKNL